jgi:hypothetical protein
MPGAYGGAFPTWEEAHVGKRPSEKRIDLLRKWVKNLIKAAKVRRTGNRWLGPWCGISPYHHFAKDDIILLEQIAKDAGWFSDVGNMVSRMVSEHEIAVKEFEYLEKMKESLVILEATAGCKDELEAQLVIQQQQLAELKEAVAQQRALKDQYSLEIQELTSLLEHEKKQVKTLADDLDVIKCPPPEDYCDMIFTLEVMRDPVVAADGFTYENEAILKWFQHHCTSPTTGTLLPNRMLIPNNSLKSHINQWREKILSGVGCNAVDGAVSASTAVGSTGIDGNNPCSVAASASMYC